MRCDDKHVEVLCSYPERFAGIIDVVHVGVVVVQMWTDLLEASAEVAVLQMDQQGSAKNRQVKTTGCIFISCRGNQDNSMY